LIQLIFEYHSVLHARTAADGMIPVHKTHPMRENKKHNVRSHHKPTIYIII